MDDLPQLTEEFLIENKKTMPKSRSGPYSKSEKESRRNEVYRLHFDYGYSARKIADLMKVNRNTVNGDISYWYSKITSTQNIFDPAMTIIMNLKRFEEQRSRLREQLDKVSELSEKLSLKRMMFDINSKVLQIYKKLGESTRRIMNLSANYLNRYMEDNKKSERYMLFSDRISVSYKAKEKIERIIKEDKSKSRTI